MFLKLFLCNILSTFAACSLWTGSSSHSQLNPISEPNLPLIMQPVYENHPFRNIPPQYVKNGTELPAPANKPLKNQGKKKVFENRQRETSKNNEVPGESANNLRKSSTTSTSRKNKKRRTLEKKLSTPEVSIQTLCPPPPSPPPPPQTECGCGTPPPASSGGGGTHQPPPPPPPPPTKYPPPPPPPMKSPPPPPTKNPPPPPPPMKSPPPPPPTKSSPPPPQPSPPPPSNPSGGGTYKPPSQSPPPPPPNNAPPPPNQQSAPPKCEVSSHSQQFKFPEKSHCEVIPYSGSSRHLQVPAIYKIIPIISGIVAIKEMLWEKFRNLNITSKRGNDQ